MRGEKSRNSARVPKNEAWNLIPQIENLVVKNPAAGVAHLPHAPQALYSHLQFFPFVFRVDIDCQFLPPEGLMSATIRERAFRSISTAGATGIAASTTR
jgi:hypothetical protein